MHEISTPPLAITCGEPAGIGPDLLVTVAQQQRSQPLVALADRELLLQRAAQLGLSLQLQDYRPGEPVCSAAGELSLLHHPLATPATAGQLDTANAPWVLSLLRSAVAGCQAGHFAGMVTGPLHKGIINDAGTPFTGHTEYLAELTATPRVVMMLATPGLRVALATTHLPLREVPDAITPALLEEVLTILDRDLRRRFAIERPRILVCGLNPHAGEQGHLGSEEQTVIEPALKTLRQRGLQLEGPLPADTLFTPRHLQGADAVLAMYHDQGLPVLKHLGFGRAVNVTLGLPLIRTSVDHGTALELAGTGQADPGSLLYAIEVAAQMHGSPGV